MLSEVSEVVSSIIFTVQRRKRRVNDLPKVIVNQWESLDLNAGNQAPSQFIISYSRA